MSAEIERLVQIRYAGTAASDRVATITVRRRRAVVLAFQIRTGSGNHGHWQAPWDGSGDIISVNGDIRITCTSRKVKWWATFVAERGLYTKGSDGSVVGILAADSAKGKTYGM